MEISLSATIIIKRITCLFAFADYYVQTIVQVNNETVLLLKVFSTPNRWQRKDLEWNHLFTSLCIEKKKFIKQD